MEDAMNIFLNPRDGKEVKKLKSRFLEGFLKFLGDYQKQIECVNHIFNLFQDEPEDTTIEKKKIIRQLAKMGILKDDPRIKKLVDFVDNIDEDEINQK